jgi:glycosyltransferase 2 family protein
MREDSRTYATELCVRALQDENFIDSVAEIRRKWALRCVLALIAVAGVYASATVWIGRSNWRIALDSVSPRDIMIVIGLVAGGLLLRAARWHYYIRTLDWDVPLAHSLSAFVASIAFTATPGKAGELVKAVLLRTRHDVSLAHGAGILMIERLGDLFAVIVLAIGGITMFTDLRGYVLACVALVGAVALIASRPAVAHGLIMRISAVPRLRPIARKLLSALDAGRQLLRPLPCVIGGVIALAAWGCEALAFYYLIDHLGIHSPLRISFSIYGLSTLAGVLSMLPGGIGGFEVVMAFLLTRLAAPASLTAIAVVIFRLCTLWLFSLIGVAFLFGWIALLSYRPMREIAGGAR